MSEVIRVRKKPVEVEAMRYTAGVIESSSTPPVPRALRRFAGSAVGMEMVGSRTHGGPGQWLPVIRTAEGRMLVSEGDYVIRGVAGELYPCKPDIFAATYDAVPEEPTDE